MEDGPRLFLSIITGGVRDSDSAVYYFGTVFGFSDYIRVGQVSNGCIDEKASEVVVGVWCIQNTMHSIRQCG